MLWNARSLKKEVNKFATLLKEENVDIITSQETLLSKNLLKIPQYKSLHDFQNRGVAFYIENHIPFSRVKDDTKLETSNQHIPTC